MKEIIKGYLEGQAEKDLALKERYVEADLDKCVEYINAQARKTLDGKSGFVEDGIVFKWARDFYIEGIAEKEKAEAAAKSEELAKEREDATKVETATVVTEKKSEGRKPEPKQRSLFDFGEE